MPASTRRAPLLRYFIIGTMLIVVAKFSAPGLLGALVAAAVAILAVGLKCHSHWGERGQGASWASDEAYYLGLLYTLVSLILAILQLFVFTTSDAGPDGLRERTNSLIGSFGIALTSTVAGILGRILLQGRSSVVVPTTGSLGDELQAGQLPGPVSDPSKSTQAKSPTRPTSPALTQSAAGTPPVEYDDVEPPLTWDLRDQLLALRRNLLEASDSFAHFTRVTLEQAERTRASAEQVVAGFHERLAEVAQAEIHAIAVNWRDATAAMHTEHEASVDQASRELLGLRERWTGLGKQAQTELANLTKRFDSAAAEALQRTEAGWSQLATALAKSAEATQASSEVHSAELSALLTDFGGLRQQLKPFGAALNDAGSAIAALQITAQESTIDSEGVRQLLQDSHQTLLALNDTAKRVDADLVSRVAEMAQAHQALTDGCTKLIADVDALCRTALDSNADRAQEATATLGQAVHQADSLKDKMEGLTGMLDKQRRTAERSTAQFENLLKDVVRKTEDQSEHRMPAREVVNPRGSASTTDPRRSPQQSNPSPVEPKTKSWWRFNQDDSPS